MIKTDYPNQPGGLSSLAKKFVMALSGLALVGFVIVHLLGNLSLYRADGASFNAYAKGLHDLGALLVAAEIGLFAVFLIHVVSGFGMKWANTVARPTQYWMWRPKGRSPSNLSSRNMIYTGGILLVFVVVHLVQFRFGPSIEQGYVTQIHGERARDLHRLVVETFKNPAFAAFYVGCMILLGMHLRHGFWSAFQSLGMARGSASRALLAASAGVGAVLAVGFLFIPVWIYFFA